MMMIRGYPRWQKYDRPNCIQIFPHVVQAFHSFLSVLMWQIGLLTLGHWHQTGHVAAYYYDLRLTIQDSTVPRSPCMKTWHPMVMLKNLVEPPLNLDNRTFCQGARSLIIHTNGFRLFESRRYILVFTRLTAPYATRTIRSQPCPTLGVCINIPWSGPSSISDLLFLQQVQSHQNFRAPWNHLQQLLYNIVSWGNRDWRFPFL